MTVKRPQGGESVRVREIERGRAFHLSAAVTNMPAHLFALSPLPALSANSYRNILAGCALFSFFTKDGVREWERKKKRERDRE